MHLALKNGKPHELKFVLPKALVLSQLPHTPLPAALTWVMKDLQGGLQSQTVM